MVIADEPKLTRPVKRLSDEPVVTTENDILLAFAELSWLHFKLDTVSKLQNAELDVIRKKYLHHFQVDSHATAAEGEDAPQTLAERRFDLEAAIADYARENKSDLVDDTCKTKDFGVGTVAFKLNPESLMPYLDPGDDDDEDDDAGPWDAAKLLQTALDKLLDEYQLPRAVERALQKKAGETGRKLADFLRCKWSWDSSGIVKLTKAKLLSNDALEPLGLKVDRAAERIEIKLKA